MSSFNSLCALLDQTICPVTDVQLIVFNSMSMYTARSILSLIAVCDLAIVCIHTSSPLPHLLLAFISPPLPLDSMSGPWMQDLAQFEDAATEAGYNAAHAGDQVPPPMAKASQVTHQPKAAPTQIDETPMEPATSPRNVDTENGQLIYSFQLESMVLIQNPNDMLLDTS